MINRIRNKLKSAIHKFIVKYVDSKVERELCLILEWDGHSDRVLRG